MMDSVTVTLSQSGMCFKKWQVIKIASVDRRSVVISLEENENSVSTRLYPYEDVEWGRFGRFIWFQLLKLEVFLKLI